jgi:hypothetical protein
MVLKGIFAVLVIGAVLGWSGPSSAEAYSPEEFFKLDLSKAVLSPKLLGPPTQFEPVAVEAKADPAAKADAVVKALPVQTAKRHVAVRTKLARRHGNPLDAEAFDARIQVWPCRSGGICNWRRQGARSN